MQKWKIFKLKMFLHATLFAKLFATFFFVRSLEKRQILICVRDFLPCHVICQTKHVRNYKGAIELHFDICL